MIHIPTINSFVRALHALPGAGDVDVFVNEELLEGNLAYKNVSRYIPIGPGSNRIQVFPSGDRTDPILDMQVDFPPSEAITVALIGQITDAQLLQVLLPFADIGPNEARVRLANLSPDSPELDLFLNDSRVIADVAYKEVTDYSSISPDTYSVQLRPSVNSDLIVARDNLLFRSGRGYTVYAVGLLEGEPALEILSVQDELPVVEEVNTTDIPAVSVVKPSPTVKSGIKIVFKYGK